WCVFKKHRHSVSTTMSLSYAYGVNTILTDFKWIGDPNTSAEAQFRYSTETRKAQYFGGVTGFRYDYRFWKERINAGANFSARYYFGDFPFQLNYGLQLGYNF